MWKKCDLECKTKKLFLFLGEEINQVGRHILADAYSHNYTPMPLNAPAVGLTLQAGMPYTLIDKWMGMEPYIKAREDGARLLKSWLKHPIENLSSDGIYWPEFDREAMLWFWKIVGLVHNFAEVFKDNGGQSVQIIANQRRRPALYYYSSDIASMLLKAILGGKARIVDVSKQSKANYLYTQSISFERDERNPSIAPPSALKGKIVLAVNPGEIHRFSPFIQNLKARFSGKIAVVSIFPDQASAKDISLKYGIPVVAPVSVPLNTDKSLASRYLKGSEQLKSYSNEPMVQSAFEHLGFHFYYYCGYRWPVLRNNFLSWRNLWEKYRPEAVIISRLPDCESQLPAESAKQLDIPIISLPHAEFLPEEKKIVDIDYALYNTSLSRQILKNAGFKEKQLHICRDIINLEEYETVTAALERDEKPWKCLVVTYPATMGESFTPKGCPSVQIKALKILASPPGYISEKLQIRIKTHPAYPEPELYCAAGSDLEKKVYPPRTPLTSALKNMDLVIALNCSYSVVIHVLRQGKPVIFFYNDPFYLNGVDLHAAARLFLPSGILVQTGDQLWNAVNSYFTDDVFAEKLRENATKFTKKYLDDSAYPTAGEIVSRFLLDQSSFSTEGKDRVASIGQPVDSLADSGHSGNGGKGKIPQIEKKLIHEKTSSWQTEESAREFMDDMAVNRLYNSVVNRRFLSYCPPGARVLDLGCGHGLLSLYLAEHGRSVVSCDISQLLLDALNSAKGSLYIETRRGDAHAIPAVNDEFDVVASRMFLPHFPDWSDILLEMIRCCRPGGRLIYTFFNRDHREMARKSANHACELESYSDTTVLNGKYLANCSLDALTALCKKLGLRVIAIHPFNFLAQNAFIGHSLGTENYEKFKSQLMELKKDDKVIDFLIWLEESVVQHLPEFMTYDQVVVLEKTAFSETV